MLYYGMFHYSMSNDDTIYYIPLYFIVPYCVMLCLIILHYIQVSEGPTGLSEYAASLRPRLWGLGGVNKTLHRQQRQQLESLDLKRWAANVWADVCEGRRSQTWVVKGEEIIRVYIYTYLHVYIYI